ncbi:hypothetical protein [Streptomyces lavendulae]|uniref:hypothetical protein n=1 Tax=Streptomyces lavendulae TaxID=1914 RepID=UPI003D9EA5AE
MLIVRDRVLAGRAFSSTEELGAAFTAAHADGLGAHLLEGTGTGGVCGGSGRGARC